MINLVHVITGLNTGGAEIMLHKAVAFADRSKFRPAVVSMLPEGPLAERIRACNVRVRSLSMRRRLPNPLAIRRLGLMLREMRADVVQTWMYHANLLGGLAAKTAGVPCIWGIHHSNLSRAVNRPRTVAVAKLCGSLSGFLPERIVCCAERSLELHACIGYRREKMLVIPNGIDISHFHPDAGARSDVRAELGLNEDSFLIGMVGRFNPQKDHANFMRGAEIFIKSGRAAHFVLCGDGMTPDNRELAAMIPENVARRVLLLGRRDDIPRISAALDLATLSSSDGEAFPNVVGEAMACEVPFVTTDVGDSGMIVGDVGVVVPPRDAEALAGGWAEIYDLAPDARIMMGKRARRRIADNFEIGGVVARYEDVYHEVVAQRALRRKLRGKTG